MGTYGRPFLPGSIPKGVYIYDSAEATTMEDDSIGLRSIVPGWNSCTYQLLYVVEVSLRELIVETFASRDGWAWYKRLPADIQAKYKSGLAKEKSNKSIRSVRHDPIYYCDFPDLSKLMESNTVWNENFAEIFGKKDPFIGSLRLAEDIRNKVAHNRTALRSDYEAVKVTYNLLLNALGEEKIRELVARSDRNTTIETDLPLLENEILNAQKQSDKCQELQPREVWERIRKERWFGIAALDYDLEPLDSLFEALDEYGKFPRSWPAYKVRPWTRARKLTAKFESALELVRQMKQDASR